MASLQYNRWIKHHIEYKLYANYLNYNSMSLAGTFLMRSTAYELDELVPLTGCFQIVFSVIYFDRDTFCVMLMLRDTIDSKHCVQLGICVCIP